MSGGGTKSRGMYFEDFEVGMGIDTDDRTISEQDILSFADLSGDHNKFHVDEEYASKTQFGKRIAHGMLGFSIATGLAVQTGIMEDTIIAFREISNFKFSNPIFIGDTIKVQMMVKELKSVPRLGGGQVILALSVINQEDKITMKGDVNFLIRSRPESEGN